MKGGGVRLTNEMTIEIEGQDARLRGRDDVDRLRHLSGKSELLKREELTAERIEQIVQDARNGGLRFLPLAPRSGRRASAKR